MTAGLVMAVAQAREALAACVLLREATRLRLDTAQEGGAANMQRSLIATETSILRGLDAVAGDLRAALDELAGGDARAAERRVRSSVARSRLVVAGVRPSWLSAEDRREEGEVEAELVELATLAAAAARDPAAPVMAAA